MMRLCPAPGAKAHTGCLWSSGVAVLGSTPEGFGVRLKVSQSPKTLKA